MKKVKIVMSDTNKSIPQGSATDRQTVPAKGQPHGWIQWKGTDVCMDLYCVCGVHGHLDSEFAYYVRCEGCGRAYLCNAHIELVPMEDEEAATKSLVIPFSESYGNM